jgi:hypothetical protein
MKKIKVMEYCRWTSYTYMKQNQQTSHDCFKWGGEGAEEEETMGAM